MRRVLAKGRYGAKHASREKEEINRRPPPPYDHDFYYDMFAISHYPVLYGPWSQESVGTVSITVTYFLQLLPGGISARSLGSALPTRVGSRRT